MPSLSDLLATGKKKLSDLMPDAQFYGDVGARLGDLLSAGVQDVFPTGPRAGSSISQAYPDVATDPAYDEKLSNLGLAGLTESAAVARGLPRMFYRGTDEVGPTAPRIKTGDDAWDSYLFAASKIESARPYGKNIEGIQANPDANIAYEGTEEFRRLKKGLSSQNLSLLDWASEIARRAKEAGFDAVHFNRQGDIGTAINNPEKFVRNVQF